LLLYSVIFSAIKVAGFLNRLIIGALLLKALLRDLKP